MYARCTTQQVWRALVVVTVAAFVSYMFSVKISCILSRSVDSYNNNRMLM